MMEKVKDSPYLSQVFLRMLLFRLFIPLMLVGLIVILPVGYLWEINIEKHQNQVAESISHTVEYHIDHGSRMLDAVAKVAEENGAENLYIFMKSTWEAYGYFDTIYYLDNDNKIKLMMPSDTRYTAIDMSNLHDFKENSNKKGVIISRPFMSLRTGEPTVYLIRHLSQGGTIMGELNLGLLQEEIENTKNISDKDFIFIMDQTGTLLANPVPELVKQHTNMSNLGIFNGIAQGKASDIYLYDGKLVLGSAVLLKETGWIVVDQISLSAVGRNYILTLVFTLLASMIIWLTLFLDLQKELKRYVVKPLEQLAVRTKALTVGNFSEANILSPIPTGFVELNKLLLDFQFMTSTLQIRETALRESENRYRGLVERLPIGLFRTNFTGEILAINPTASSILGYPNIENLLKINIIKILNTYSMDNEQEKFSIENIRDLNKYETQIQCCDGKIMWIQISSQIACDNKYEMGFIEGSIINITERKETEAKINAQQELIIEAEKEKREVLEKALIMKDEFISLISHEFKTPLNVIYSAVQLIESVYFDKIPERVQELMGNIKQNTFRQLRLSNNLLDITRMNSGIAKLNRKNVDIVFLSKVITQSVEPYTNQKNIKIAFESNLSSKIISIDEEKYERIILNILSNAMKFTESGGEITVTLNENKKSNCVQIKITDTGIGIPEDKQDIIFERFGQVDSNLSRQAEGTGIGLSLVKLLVNILEGTIKVESKLGIGSTFIISFPIKKEVADNYSEICFDVENRLVSETKVEFSDIYL